MPVLALRGMVQAMTIRYSGRSQGIGPLADETNCYTLITLPHLAIEFPETTH